MQLSRLKRALANLRKDHHWVTTEDGASCDLPITWLVTDGCDVFLRDADGYVDLMRAGGQRTFAFVVEVGRLRDELIADVGRRYGDKVAFCTFAEAEPIYAVAGSR